MPTWDSITSNSAAGSSDITVNHDPDDSANLLLVGYFGRGSTASTPPTVVSISYDTDTTPVLIRATTQDRFRCQAWYVTNPIASARPTNIVVSGEQSSVFVVASIIGANIGTPIDTDRGQATTTQTPSRTIMTADGALLAVDFLATVETTHTPDSDQTLRLDTDSGLPTTVDAVVSTSTVTPDPDMGWTLGASVDVAYITMILGPAGGGSYGFIL